MPVRRGGGGPGAFVVGEGSHREQLARGGRDGQDAGVADTALQADGIEPLSF